MKMLGNTVKISAAAVLLVCLTALLAVSLCGCDRRGSLTEKETWALYDKAKEMVSSGELWTYDASRWLADDWPSAAEKDADIELIKTAAQAAFGNEEEPEMYGTWFGSKAYCRTCVTSCDAQVGYKGTQMTLKRLSFSEYKDGRYLVEAELERPAEGGAEHVSVLFAPPEP